MLNSVFQFSYIKYTCLHCRTADSQLNINEHSQLRCWEQNWSSGLPHFAAAPVLIEARLGTPQGTFCGVTFGVASPSLQVQEEYAPGHKLQHYKVYSTDLCRLLCTLHLPHFHLQGWTQWGGWNTRLNTVVAVTAASLGLAFIILIGAGELSES